jgi:endo-1,4-beta-xylanase
VTVSDEQGHSGSSALKVTGRTATWHGAEYDVMSLVTPGDSYDVTVWARPTSGSVSSTLRLTREVQGCGAEQFAWLASVDDATDEEWVELSGTLTLPSSCDPSKLVVYVESTDATASYYVDDTSMSAQ